MGVAADVPTKFDVLIDSQGYRFADSQEVKAELGITPVFVPRQNVQGDYGDNQQDFWLTATQRDWSLGEQQRYFRSSDEDAVRRFWKGDAIDVVTTPGQVALRPGVGTASGGGPSAIAPSGTGANLIVAGTTNLYTLTNGGTLTSQGAHGLGRQPDCLAGDYGRAYLSSAGVGSVGVRKWTGAAFSTFSATGVGSLAFLNNTLYGLATANLYRYDSAGAATSIFNWHGADGTNFTVQGSLLSFGGKLLILLPFSFSNSLPSELWLYDGTAPAKIAELQSNFLPNQMCVSLGTVYISGLLRENAEYRPAVYYYSDGNLGLLWKASAPSDLTSIGRPAITPFGDGVVFNDDTQGKLLLYSPSLGGAHPIGAWSVSAGGAPVFATAGNSGFFAGIGGGSDVQYFPTSTRVASGDVITSVFDFDSSLSKLFHGVRLDFDLATDGNGGTVDVAYRLNDAEGSFTSLATGVTAGLEISLGSQAGRGIAIKVTLNKGTSTKGPVLKRIAVRGSPNQPQYQRASYVLECTGSKRDPDSYIELRDGNKHGKSGLEMVADLIAAAGKSTIVITDPVNGTFTGVIEADSLKIQAIRRAEEFLVSLTVRGVG